MKRYAIYAYESTYGGLHGMNDYAVVTVGSEREAESIGYEMAIDVIESYECITSGIEEDAICNGCEEGTDEYWDYIEEAKNENAEYEVYEITTPTDKSDEVLSKEFWNDKKGFLAYYCGVEE